MLQILLSYTVLLLQYMAIPNKSLLFLVFINDLPDAVNHSSLYMFADDTKCAKLIRNSSDSVLLQDDVTSLGKWSSDWKLQFKVTKCVLLRFCTKGASVCHSYSIGGNEVPEHTSHKDLGVVFSSDLIVSSLTSTSNHMTTNRDL